MAERSTPPVLASPKPLVPVVVALHGWGANTSTLSPMVAPPVRAGMTVLLFDAANHGQSSSEDFSSLPCFAEDLAAVQACLREIPAVDAARCAVLGHAVGSAAVLLHACTACRRAWEDFEQRMMRPTFADHRIDDAMLDRIRARYAPHHTPYGAHFIRPMHVRLLRKTP